jgi:G:T-mismatch repair DNA endonuclease (very short patch repair protein)
MDNVIKNLKPDLRETILNEVISANIALKKDIEKYVRDKLDLSKSGGIHTKKYWLSRGWNFDESYVKAKENKQMNCKSVYSREFWLERINPATNTYYTVEEADFERNSRRPIRKEYWIKKGYSESDSMRLAEETKNSNNKKGAEKSASSNVRNITSRRRPEYFIARGYSKEDAKKLVSESQKYFSKEICIEKYGEEQGLKIWQDRQNNWQNTLKNKPSEEIARINKLKLFKGGSVSKGETILFEYLQKEKIPCKKQHAIQKDDISYYVYDIVYQNKIIEYNGDFWHANPKKYKRCDVLRLPNNTTTAEKIWKKDQGKIQFAQDQGYEVLIVWESDFKENKEEVLTKCIQFLTQ